MQGRVRSIFRLAFRGKSVFSPYVGPGGALPFSGLPNTHKELFLIRHITNKSALRADKGASMLTQRP